MPFYSKLAPSHLALRRWKQRMTEVVFNFVLVTALQRVGTPHCAGAPCLDKHLLQHNVNSFLGVEKLALRHIHGHGHRRKDLYDARK